MLQRSYLQLVALLLVACIALALLAPAPVSGEFSLHFNYNYPEMLKVLD